MELNRALLDDKGAKTKAVILDTALKIASLAGIEGLTIGELAKAVGMSKSGLFAHFQGKDNLQLSVLQKATEQFVDAVMRPAFREPRGEARLKALFNNWLDHLDDQSKLPGGSVLISASIELDDRPGILRDFVKKAQNDLIRNIERAAKISVQEGDFRADLDVELFAWTMYSFVLGYHHFTRMLQDPKAQSHVKRSFKTLLSVSRAPERGAGSSRAKLAKKKRTTKSKK